MNKIKTLISILLCLSLLPLNTFAQVTESIVANEYHKRYPNQSNYTCEPLSEEKTKAIYDAMANVLNEHLDKMTNNVPTTRIKVNTINIFSNNKDAQNMIQTSYLAYEEIQHNDNWKDTEYAQKTPEELNKIFNNLTADVRELLQEDPFYKTSNFSSACFQIGKFMATFLFLCYFGELITIALPTATSVTQTAALNGLMFNSANLFHYSPFLLQTTKFSELLSFSLGVASNIEILNKIDKIISNNWGILSDDETMLGAQKKILAVLNSNFKLDKEIKNINNDKKRSDFRKRTDIATRYKDAIVKIYALEHIKTYLQVGEKSEKYIWALLDLSTLLQTEEFVNFGYERVDSIKIIRLPTLMDRTPEMIELVKKIMAIHQDGYRIKSLPERYNKKIQQEAKENIESRILEELNKNN